MRFSFNCASCPALYGSFVPRGSGRMSQADKRITVRSLRRQKKVERRVETRMERSGRQKVWEVAFIVRPSGVELPAQFIGHKDV